MVNCGAIGRSAPRMKAIVVLNKRAGALATAKHGDFSVSAFLKSLASQGITASVQSLANDDLIATLRAAIAEQPDALVVGGGDGTLSAAAGVLADTGIALGILPLGTLNHFAHDLGIPEDWREAVAALTVAPPKRVDVGEVNGHVFINNCSLGSYADAVRRRDALRRRKGHRKMLAMLLASAAVFRELRRMRIEITLPDQTLALRTPLLVVANNRYSGHLLDSCLRPRLDGGELCLYTTRAAKHRTILRLAWQTLFRRLDAADELEIHVATAATIATAKMPIPIAADGEVLEMAGPFRFRIRPGALRVLGTRPPAER